ncbi:MAG: hypothetical protein PUB63_06270 [Clostridia bacterium]|nr:hypothetical protein [Clostridia bacterium]
MSKKNDVNPKRFEDMRYVLLGGLLGTGVLCLLCLMFACLLFFRILPMDLLVFYAALSGLIGGFAAAVLIGSRGRILFFIPLAGIVMLVFLAVLGQILFDSVFSPASNPLMLSAVFFGLIAGSLFANRR